MDPTSRPHHRFTHAPPRIYGILAREAPVGVLFRRGPSDWVQIIRWDLSNDTFEEGHWFHGRIYEQRGDLSPDGKYMIYFAAKRSASRPKHEQTWTAVSDEKAELSGLRWADVDARGRIVGTRGGEVIVADPQSALRDEWTVVADFTSNRPSRQQAPDWAEIW